MNTTQLIGLGLSFLFIFLSGYQLGHSGSPYSVIVLTIHKLIAVALFVMLIITTVRTNQKITLGTTELIAGIITGLFFLSLIATGGLLSSNKEMPAIVITLHKIAPYLTVLSTIITLYLLH